jgi:signal transduction histidine kinase
MGLAFPVDEPKPSTSVAPVLDTFLAALMQETPGIFLAEWSQVLRQALFAHQHLFGWQAALSVMRRELLPFVMGTAVFNLADNLLHQSRVMLTEVLQQASMQREREERRNTLLLGEINETLLMTFDIPKLLDSLTMLLPQIGVKNCCLTLYETLSPDEQIKQVPDWVRLILAYDENGRVTLPIEGQRFPSTHLIPPNLLPAHRRRNRLVISLYIRETQLGYGLFEVDYPDTGTFNLLRNQISNSIHRALLIQQIQQSKEGLEKRVKERTRELEIQNAELERFTYTVSHDLKSPLITIQGFLGFLEKDALAGNVERMKGDIARISGGVNQMRILLDELLELSRVGRLVNPPEPVPLADLVHEAILLVSGQITTGGVQVVVASELPIVYGDRHRLIEVVQNLLDNAVKFMGQQPEPRIEIGAKNIEAETLCYVRDNGMGISPQYHGKVFGLFDRLDQSVEGTGIGLALVKRIIEVHNGRIWVESEGKGKGSTFYFTLPTEMEQGSYGMSAPL